MLILLLAYKSLRARAFTSALTIFSIALPVMLLVGVDHLRDGARAGFAGTLSHTDLIAGARGSGLSLLLSSVFHLGGASNSISWESYQHFAHHPAVAWTIPFSIGDSFHGASVVATDGNFYAHYHYRGNTALRLEQGHAADGLFDVVPGAEVARRLGLHLGQKIVLAHGIEEHSILNHDTTPFTVVGVLAPTATPVDHALYITLLGEEAMHAGWADGTPPALGDLAPALDPSRLKIEQITSFLIGTRSRISVLSLQREIDTYTPEPLTAVIPAYTLQELWQLLDTADLVLSVVSAAVLVVGLLAMLSALYAALNERRGEVALLRAVGLQARQIFALFILESVLLATTGAALGLAAMYVVVYATHTWIAAHYGLPLSGTALSPRVELYLAATIGSAALLGAIPAWRAYRNSLGDVLSST